MNVDFRKILAIARKDLGHYFVSPIGYVVVAIFFLITGYFFSLLTAMIRTASMAPIFQNTVVMLLFISPMITMRLWSEEEKSGTAELLKTSPLTTWEIVLGKYLAACGFFGVMLSVTFVYLLILVLAGSPDPGPVISCYLGYCLIGMSFFAIGLLSSTFSENQIISAVTSYGILIMLWMIGAAGDNTTGKLGEFLKSLSLFDHLGDFLKGVIDLTNIIYFLSVIFICLFFSVKVLESRRS